jgi:16S rRNA (cytosine1402-N4)-methyltransferase
MFNHISVLLNECIEGLNIKADGIYVDATIGGAGHSCHIIKELSSKGLLVGFDQDQVALEASRERLTNLSPQFKLIHSNFAALKSELAKLGISQVDGFLFDLGVSSVQFDESDRGFSYRFDARLDMRMNKENDLDAFKVVNNYSKEELMRIFYEYGEEKFAKNIANKIVERRKEALIETTFQLVDVIRSALPSSVLREKGHPAKKVFQAIRIEVNRELDVLKEGLKDALDLLKPGGRICVITFHSLEDRIVKDMFREKCEVAWNKNMPFKLETSKSEYRLVNKKPIISQESELEANNRAHSAKLRIIERV